MTHFTPFAAKQWIMTARWGKNERLEVQGRSPTKKLGFFWAFFLSGRGDGALFQGLRTLPKTDPLEGGHSPQQGQALLTAAGRPGGTRCNLVRVKRRSGCVGEECGKALKTSQRSHLEQRSWFDVGFYTSQSVRKVEWNRLSCRLLNVVVL